MFRHPLTRMLLLLLVTMILAAGCAAGPAPKPAPDQVPQGDEPTISLFDNKTGERKNIKLEEYVQGVVAAEMDTKWPVNALAAQAILARTFTMENIKAGRVKQLHGTDASTSVEEFQAYDPSKINDNVRQAVERTRGKVVTYGGSFIHAWFSACDGGISATAEEGLAYTKEPTPYVKEGVQDGCLAITDPKNKSWEVRIPVSQVRTAVQKTTGKDPGPVTSASIAQKGPSGRAERLKIGSETVGGPALRLALGSEKVRSMLLSDIRVEGGELVLTGKGFGHGVGMCQWGARLLAEQGKSPEDIIKTYFKDIEIQKQWK
ncbi:SpoIID/LytB domain-containing protein [Pelotomaculum terephthalicicum JT]|uniref:SpoIID/LytB domain-containing protein n=2 Tax=Pelotomaculum TaxID=191373 RepID=UPI0009D4C169|nr:SpoIID/LytB domain-containing protein [Pelotomaculum terephthalicicum]MCG9968308.1 SpoIID/LytB domain-containing protein [Pelotomaculum terephthalicicum JT]OPY63245.1 MAG: Amidase enhancer precursor [Pelotomaculum sp. PtaU1.Bin065]